MDVLLKEGLLFLHGVKFGKRIWRKIWVRAFKASEAGIGRIEMYDAREGVGVSGKLKKAEKRVIRLAECLSVTPALGESCPTGCTAFYLNTAQRIYMLAAPTHDQWVPALCSLAFQPSEGGGGAGRVPGDDADVPMTENNIYSSLSPGQFQVTVASSEASVRCCMFGLYLLSLEKESLSLLDMKTGRVKFCWPYRFLRRFGQVKEGITIEAGRRCQTGEGLFVFLSKQGNQIHRAIEEAIMHQRVQDLLSEATALSRDNTVQESSPPSPQMGVERRTLALPPLPGPKPSAVRPQPNLYARVKPLPKPRNVPPPPALPASRNVPTPPALPASRNVLPPPALPEPKLLADPQCEMKPKRLEISKTPPDYESADWDQNAQSTQETSDQQLYSKLKPPHHTRRKPDDQTNRENPNSSRRSPEVSNRELPVSFKEILSDVLFKNITRTGPSSNPSSNREKSELSADSEYYEIQ